MSNIPTKHRDIYIFQGEDFSHTFQVLDSIGNEVDISGATGSSKMKTNPATSATGNHTELAFSLVGDGTTGSFELSLTAANTITDINTHSYLMFDGYGYDVEIELPGGTTIKPFRGSAYITPEITS